MKDATGELSMTAVAVVAIAAIGVVFTTLVWPQIRRNILRSTYCSQAFNCSGCDGGMCTCNYCPNDDAGGSGGGSSTSDVDCPNPEEIQCPDNTRNA